MWPCLTVPVPDARDSGGGLRQDGWRALRGRRVPLKEGLEAAALGRPSPAGLRSRLLHTCSRGVRLEGHTSSINIRDPSS